MNVPFPEVFKAMLDGDLGSLISWVVSLPIARGMELDDL